LFGNRWIGKYLIRIILVIWGRGRLTYLPSRVRFFGVEEWEVCKVLDECIALMAEDTINLVCKKMGIDEPCRTHLEPLPLGA
jgi:hypothetical protein